jgi:hypothetical protein
MGSGRYNEEREKLAVEDSLSPIRLVEEHARRPGMLHVPRADRVIRFALSRSVLPNPVVPMTMNFVYRDRSAGSRRFRACDCSSESS